MSFSSSLIQDDKNVMLMHRYSGILTSSFLSSHKILFDNPQENYIFPKRLSQGERGGGGWLYCFPLKFLDPLRLPVWRHIVTGKNLGWLVQVSEGCDSYLDERGLGKAKKLANIIIYRLFDRMCVSRFDILCPWLYNFVNLFCGPCWRIAIYFTGPARSSKLKYFFSLK